METLNTSQARLLYNPQLQSAEMTEKLFVVRQKQFDFLLNKLLQEKEDSIPQHYLIIGQRGMGKTTILKRIEVELHKEQYRQQLIPLLFREEQYDLKDLADFWLNNLDALADSLESENYPAEIVANIDKTIQELSRKTLEIVSDEAYKFLMKTCSDLHRRPVLLIDNIDIVFRGLSSNDKNKQVQWALRKLLSENGAPIIVSGGITTTDDVAEYKMPFYDFFQIQYLKKLNYEEFVELLNNLATVTNSDARVFASIKRNTSRQKALLELTGGSPRIIVMLFDQIAKGFSTNINDDLNILADAITPLYKAKFEELSLQQRHIVGAIALNWDAISLRKLATLTRMKNNQLSPQLKRLVDEGWIETTPAYKDKGNAYFISERFFNIYYLIRNSSRRHKDKIYCLSKFLECFYGKDELERISDTLLKQDICTAEQMWLQLAISRIKIIKLNKRRQLDEKVFETFLNNDELRKEFDFPEKYFLLKKGESLLKKQNYDEAIDCFNKLIDANEKEKCAWCLKGKSLLELEKYEEALECFNKFTEVKPEELCAWSIKGDLLSYMERFDEALICFDKVLEINSGHEPTLGKKGEIFDKLGQYENALNCFGKIIVLNAKNDSAWIQKGKIFCELEQYDDALNCFEEAIKLKPKNEFAWMGKGEILTVLKKYNDALICFEKILKFNPKFEPAWFIKGKVLIDLERYEDAISCYNKVLKFNPNSEPAWLLKGQTLNKIERYEDAVSCYDISLKINPNFEVAWFFKGVALIDLKRYKDAISCFDKCIESNPKEETFYFNKGKALKELGAYEEAINCLEESIKLNAQDENFWYEKGLCLFNLQRFKEAIVCLDKTIELNPSFAFYWAFKGAALSCIQHFEDAIECYERSIKLNPQIYNFWSSKGFALAFLKRYEEANICYEEAIKLDSRDADVWRYKGDCLQEMQLYEGAIACYDKAIELNPNDSILWNEKGYSLIDLEHFEETIECCTKAIELDANNDSAMCNKGYALIELKKYNKAAEVYEQSLSVNPQNLFAKFSLLFLYRDKLDKMEKAIELFNSIDEQKINQDKDFASLYYLDKACFDLYKRNEGLAKESLLLAFEVFEKENKLADIANIPRGLKFGSVVIKLGYGFWLLNILEEKGYDIVLSPYYSAIQALEIEKQEGKKSAEIYLNNRAVEISDPARTIIERIRKHTD